MIEVRRRTVLAALAAVTATGRPARAEDTLRVGVMSGDAEVLMERVADEAKARGYRIVPVADTIVAPIGLYSRKVKTAADLPRGARIGLDLRIGSEAVDNNPYHNVLATRRQRGRPAAAHPARGCAF